MIEEEIAKRYPEGKMRCPVHLSVGQEASAVGICQSLNSGDKMVSTHRGHAHYLAKGGSLKALIGEIYGKISGCSKGNGGSMHLLDLSCGFYGSTSIVGGTIPIGVGLALSDKLQGKDHTTVICFGDAAIEEGVFHEAANFASLHNLNVIFACENNEYSCYTHISNRQPTRSGEGFASIANCHGLSFCQSDEDVETVKYNTKWILKHLPGFLEIPAWRQLEHCGPNNDDHLGYRMQRGFDPLPQDGKEIIQQEIDEAFAAAEAAPYPDKSEIGKYVFAPTHV